MSLATVQNATLIAAVRVKIANISSCIKLSFANYELRLKTFGSICVAYSCTWRIFSLADFNLETAVRPYSQFGQYEWPVINKTINWAPNHPITGTQCTHLSLTDDFIYSADCVYGPVLALCDSQYSNKKYYNYMIKIYLFRNEFDNVTLISGGKRFHMHLEMVKKK